MRSICLKVSLATGVVFFCAGCSTQSPDTPAEQAPNGEPSVNLQGIRREMRDIIIGLHRYHEVHQCFPPAWSAGKEGTKLLSWRVHLLPFLGHQDLYDQFHLNESWDSPHNQTLIGQMPDLYSSGDNSLKPGTTRLLAVSGLGTAFDMTRPKMRIVDIKDGVSMTLIIVRASPESAVVWTQPADWTAGAAQQKSLDDGSGWFLGGLGDGTVRQVATVKMDSLLAPWLTIDAADRSDRAVFYDLEQEGKSNGPG